MATESNFDPWAVSPKNAQGLMQLMPDTATRFKVRQIQDPVQNIRGGMAYLRWLLAYFEGDLALVLAAYNAGERAVERYQGVPPYAETRHYVQRILSNLGGQRQHPFDPSVTPPSSVLKAVRDPPACGDRLVGERAFIRVALGLRPAHWFRLRPAASRPRARRRPRPAAAPRR